MSQPSPGGPHLCIPPACLLPCCCSVCQAADLLGLFPGWTGITLTSTATPPQARGASSPAIASPLSSASAAGRLLHCQKEADRPEPDIPQATLYNWVQHQPLLPPQNQPGGNIAEELSFADLTLVDGTNAPYGLPGGDCLDVVSGGGRTDPDQQGSRGETASSYGSEEGDEAQEDVCGLPDSMYSSPGSPRGSAVSSSGEDPQFSFAWSGGGRENLHSAAVAVASAAGSVSPQEQQHQQPAFAHPAMPSSPPALAASEPACSTTGGPMTAASARASMLRLARGSPGEQKRVDGAITAQGGSYVIVAGPAWPLVSPSPIGLQALRSPEASRNDAGSATGTAAAGIRVVR